jgi:hypothetical protein
VPYKRHSAKRPALGKVSDSGSADSRGGERGWNEEGDQRDQLVGRIENLPNKKIAGNPPT